MQYGLSFFSYNPIDTYKQQAFMMVEEAISEMINSLAIDFGNKTVAAPKLRPEGFGSPHHDNAGHAWNRPPYENASKLTVPVYIREFALWTLQYGSKHPAPGKGINEIILSLATNWKKKYP